MPLRAAHAPPLAATVRRLTPRECERLQGFPDDWTAHLADGRPVSDSARYRFMGNAVTVNVVAWLGARLATADTVDPPARPHGEPRD